MKNGMPRDEFVVKDARVMVYDNFKIFQLTWSGVGVQYNKDVIYCVNSFVMLLSYRLSMCPTFATI